MLRSSQYGNPHPRILPCNRTPRRTSGNHHNIIWFQPRLPRYLCLIDSFLLRGAFNPLLAFDKRGYSNPHRVGDGLEGIPEFLRMFADVFKHVIRRDEVVGQVVLFAGKQLPDAGELLLVDGWWPVRLRAE